MLRAAAERWRKGADIHLKRLDVQKARHQAAQVKETRQVSVNNSPAPSPRGTQNSSGLNSAKGPGKANSGGTGKGQKNSSGGTGNSSGGSGAGGRGKDGGGTGRGRTDNAAGKGQATPAATDRRGPKSAGGDSPKTPKASTDRSKANGPASAGAGGGGAAKEGKAGKEGKPGKDAPKPSTGATDTSAKDKTTKPGTGTGAADTKPADTTGKSTSANGDAKKAGAGADLTKTAGKDAPKTAPGKDATGKGADGAGAGADGAGKTPPGRDVPGKDSAGKNVKPGTGTTKTTPDSTSKTDETGKTPTPTTGTTSAPDRTEQPPRTQTSREAGYRDGHRAARLVGHVEAYRDGARDGWDDGRKTTTHDKTRLDTARTDRLKHREDPAVTGPQPIPVHNINASHVTLPGGQTHTRGEIRTVKHYERNLTEKATGLQKAAEATRSLKQHAQEQAAAAAALAEQARAVEGGDKLIASLTRLQEQATLQAGLADNLNARSVRAAESTNTLLANVATRYEAIYKAVCDSESTQPAKLFWYRDGAPTHA
ncbi:hypothetical protein P1P75_40070 [Streptomyces sp. ID05-39B]|uniref:hypothetical protein n=1 Tax=Streptomyces sp. ID05-39B TaxID=3028664 RepID=UPI0029BA0AC3|nr:hypothetical protein [Streptomyces sp. ID05-39B]MDX3532430.1 hypothetical protein [Streptomyces sp. ID05-39B]